MRAYKGKRKEPIFPIGTGTPARPRRAKARKIGRYISRGWRGLKEAGNGPGFYLGSDGKRSGGIFTTLVLPPAFEDAHRIPDGQRP